MNTLTNESIINANEQTYMSLLVSIEAGIGMLQIFIAVCDADRQRENIIANYEKELAYTDNIYRVYLDSQEPSLKQAITQQVTLKENAIATVLGAEKLGSFNQDELLKKFFGYLQWTREALRELKMPIILWIPSRIYAQIAKQAPDFWSWRNGVFHFQPEPSLVTGELLINRNSEVILDNQASSIFSPEQLEASLVEAVNQWGVNSSKLETLYSQLGNLYSKRVQSGKSADRERELALAEKYFNRAIVLQTQFQQQDALASSLNDLAGLYESQGRYNDAEPLYLQSLDIWKRQLGDDHPSVATSLNNLALLYRSQGRYNDAEPLYLQSLDIWKRQLGDDHPSVATSLNNLAGLYESQGRYNDAEPLYLQSLDIWKRQLGDDHPDVASSLNNLALLYRSQGRYNDAEPLCLQSLEIWKRQLGDDHPNVATSLNNLAALYISQGRYNDAEPLCLQSLEIWKRQLGDDHPNVATSLNDLALLYRLQGRYNDAEPLCLQSLEIWKRQLGDDHPYVATSLNNLAALYISQGRYNDAEPLCLQSLEIWKRQLGDDHPNVATSLNDLAVLYESQGKYSEAENLAQQALAIYQTRLGNEHPDTQNVAVGVKLFYVMGLLHCNKKTLIDILQKLAQQANFPAFNTETALTLLERIENNPELLSSIRESLQQQTDASDDNT
ncbi:tetratricopeptide repeat protein [Dolichospermum heterosporum]|uniref:Tetratricopeptide repeat protein n=1 Tax=Dolichospermum heterosporum TAC447 TaxID=747523 RepID=A0ABY5M1Q1_9CYAN|nr:tetratricopeptide repeat protein [Dolichospermum heterosporum]UUO17420.1 tetratricopeptide repeat protein [Dolichospermum heterosporum TAC447]